jgi:serine/threonine-protein kinase
VPDRILAHYEILAKIGEGGMGTVYRALDTRLHREVALKLLPEGFDRDPERVARFQREARTLASLNHPNIAGLYGFEQADGERFLVMELVEGEDLFDRLGHGALPREEALDLALQIAQGLEEAHERGVVHRDLKPANIKITPDGKAKILDFGLARAYTGENVVEGDPAQSPTITAAMTQPGVILGTAAYMSPEQAKGRSVDRRTDLWAFGVILWEMLTGRRLFLGDSVSDTLAAVLRAPIPWDDLPDDTPVAVRRLLERCLERDPHSRLRDIGEARVRLERWKRDPSTLHERVDGLPEPAVSSTPRRLLPWAVAGLAVLVAAAAVFVGQLGSSTQLRPLRLEIHLPQQEALRQDRMTSLFLSRDGTQLGYIAAGRIHVKRLDRPGAQVLDGTDDAYAACFSPDGQWIAYMANGQLFRISATGGAPVRVCEATDSRGLTWVNESTLVFSPTFASGLSIVSLEDGIARPLTQLDESRGERSHRTPRALPDGESVLFLCQYFDRDYDEGDIQRVRLDGTERATIYRGGAAPHYARPGQLLFVRDHSLFAVPFDLQKNRTRGLAVPVLDQLRSSVGDQESDNGSAAYDISDTGLLVYQEGSSSDSRSQLVRYDFATSKSRPLGDSHQYSGMVLSLDGSTLAVMRGEAPSTDIYTVDMAEGSQRRLTFSDRSEILGTFSDDGTWFFYSVGDEQSNYTVFRKRTDGSTTAEPLFSTFGTVYCNSVSPEGRRVLLTTWGGANLWDVQVLDLEDLDQGAQPYVDGPGQQYNGMFSPDGRWVLYADGGADENRLIIRSFPDTGARWEIHSSPNASAYFGWIEDGAAVACREGQELLRIPLTYVGRSVQAGRPRVLHTGHFVQGSQWPTEAVLPDGKGALVLVPENRGGTGTGERRISIRLATDWFHELTTRAAAP